MAYQFAGFLIFLLNIYLYLIFATIIMSWLVAFEVLNLRNEFARKATYWLHRMTEPVMRPARQIIPAVGGIDFSPIAVIFAIFMLQNLIIMAAGG